MKKTGKTVRFSNVITIIFEPKYLAEDLHLMRIGDFIMRWADRDRMERLLTPILTHSHREKIYRKIYGFSIDDDNTVEEVKIIQSFNMNLCIH